MKSSAYVLPNSSEAREDFEWIKTEILAMGGQALVLAAEALDPATRQEVIELFQTARDRDFREIRNFGQALLERFRSRAPRGPGRRRLVQSLRRLRERFREVEAVDFFGAPGRSDAARVLDELDRLAKRGQIMRKQPTPSKDLLDANDYLGRVWVTRARPGVDRMSSAWLIRRFVDPRARFAFGDAPSPKGAVPFDLFGAELGHQGSSCTFETIARRFGIDDPAVRWLGRIVHDLDLKEEAHDIPEKAAVGRMVEGLRRMCPDDQMLIQEGITMFEALYRSYGGPGARPGRKPAPKRARRWGR